MTSNTPETTRPATSAQAVRDATFSVRLRGLDEVEVNAFLNDTAEELHRYEQEQAELRNEIQRLRERPEPSAGGQGGAISDQAVALFSQAQQVADGLITEAVEHARDLMATARSQQRDIMAQAHSAAEAAVRRSGAAAADGTVGGYDKPVPEIEYVRTFTQVAQIQLRSVLDALDEQVEKLSDLPRLRDRPEVAPEPGLPAQLRVEQRMPVDQDAAPDTQIWPPPSA